LCREVFAQRHRVTTLSEKEGEAVFDRHTTDWGWGEPTKAKVIFWSCHRSLKPEFDRQLAADKLAAAKLAQAARARAAAEA
jgi:hypothetical protein